MSDQQELRHHREALAQAVNSHDLEAVLSFIDPSFVAKTKRGVSVGYEDMSSVVGQMFEEEKEYQETVEIEQIDESSDSAKLTVRRIERGRLHNSQQVGLFTVLGIAFLFMGFISTKAQWAFIVAGFGCFGLAYYMKRPRERTVRYHETWRMIDGRWLLVEEQEL